MFVPVVRVNPATAAMGSPKQHATSELLKSGRKYTAVPSSRTSLKSHKYKISHGWVSSRFFRGMMPLVVIPRRLRAHATAQAATAVIVWSFHNQFQAGLSIFSHRGPITQLRHHLQPTQIIVHLFGIEAVFSAVGTIHLSDWFHPLAGTTADTWILTPFAKPLQSHAVPAVMVSIRSPCAKISKTEYPIHGFRRFCT